MWWQNNFYYLHIGSVDKPSLVQSNLGSLVLTTLGRSWKAAPKFILLHTCCALRMLWRQMLKGQLFSFADHIMCSTAVQGWNLRFAKLTCFSKCSKLGVALWRVSLSRAHHRALKTQPLTINHDVKRLGKIHFALHTEVHRLLPDLLCVDQQINVCLHQRNLAIILNPCDINQLSKMYSKHCRSRLEVGS